MAVKIARVGREITVQDRGHPGSFLVGEIAPASATALALFDDGRLKASALAGRFRGSVLYVGDIQVERAARGAGLGGRLLEAALREASRKGARLALLHVLPEGEREADLVRFYQRHGFRVAGREASMYVCDVGLLFMTRKVGPRA